MHSGTRLYVGLATGQNLSTGGGSAEQPSSTPSAGTTGKGIAAKFWNPLLATSTTRLNRMIECPDSPKCGFGSLTASLWVSSEQHVRLQLAMGSLTPMVSVVLIQVTQTIGNYADPSIVTTPTTKPFELANWPVYPRLKRFTTQNQSPSIGGPAQSLPASLPWLHFRDFDGDAPLPQGAIAQALLLN